MMRRPKLLKRREIALPTWPVVVAALAGLGGLLLLAIHTIHPFLAVTRPSREPDLLVVEGWMADYNLPRVIEAYRQGPYARVAVTANALDKGSFLQSYKSYGAVTAATLKELGLNNDDLLVGATVDTFRHRTYMAAMALKQAVDASGMKVESLNVFSQAAHSRRSWLIFRKVFGEDVDVGIVALPDENYDNDRWWGSSAGIKTVGMESIALVHEWLLDSGRTEGDRN